MFDDGKKFSFHLIRFSLLQDASIAKSVSILDVKCVEDCSLVLRTTDVEQSTLITLNNLLLQKWEVASKLGYKSPLAHVSFCLVLVMVRGQSVKAKNIQRTYQGFLLFNSTYQVLVLGTGTAYFKELFPRSI